MPPEEKGFCGMVIMGERYDEKAEAGKQILEICKRITNPDPRPLGEYRGFKTEIGFDTFDKEFYINLCGKLRHKVMLGQDANGIITRLDNAIESLQKKHDNCVEVLQNLELQVENTKAEIAKPFADEAILAEKTARLDVLNAELNMDKKENEIADDAPEQSDDGKRESAPEEEEEPERTSSDRDER